MFGTVSTYGNRANESNEKPLRLKHSFTVGTCVSEGQPASPISTANGRPCPLGCEIATDIPEKSTKKHSSSAKPDRLNSSQSPQLLSAHTSKSAGNSWRLMTAREALALVRLVLGARAAETSRVRTGKFTATPLALG